MWKELMQEKKESGKPLKKGGNERYFKPIGELKGKITI